MISSVVLEVLHGRPVAHTLVASSFIQLPANRHISLCNEIGRSFKDSTLRCRYSRHGNTSCSLYFCICICSLSNWLRQLKIMIFRCCSFAAGRQFVHFEGAHSRGNRIASNPLEPWVIAKVNVAPVNNVAVLANHFHSPAHMVHRMQLFARLSFTTKCACEQILLWHVVCFLTS